MSQNGDVPKNQNEEGLQTSANHHFLQPRQRRNQYPYVLATPIPFAFNQRDMHSFSRPMSDPAPGLTLTIGRNLPPERNNDNSNGVVIPRRSPTRRTRAVYPRGRMPPLMRRSSSQSERGSIETNWEYPSAPPGFCRTRYPRRITQAPSGSFALNQHGAYSGSRPIFNPAPQLSFSMGQNLPPEDDNISHNRAAIPSPGNLRARGSRAINPRGRIRMPWLMCGSSSSSGRVAVDREYMNTNRQYLNAPLSTSTARDPRIAPIPNRLYDPNYAVNGLPVDPFLRLMELNPDFGNNTDSA